MAKLKAATVSDGISKHLGNSHLGKSKVLTLKKTEILSNLLEVSEGN